VLIAGVLAGVIAFSDKRDAFGALVGRFDSRRRSSGCVRSSPTISQATFSASGRCAP
jgi:hypothetical protein